MWRVVPGAEDMRSSPRVGLYRSKISAKTKPDPRTQKERQTSVLCTHSPPYFTYLSAYTKSQETYWLQPMAERPLARRNSSLVTPRASLLLRDVRL